LEGPDGYRCKLWKRKIPPNGFRIKAADGIRKNKALENPDKFITRISG